MGLEGEETGRAVDTPGAVQTPRRPSPAPAMPLHLPGPRCCSRGGRTPSGSGASGAGLPGPPWPEGQPVRALGLGSECEKAVLRGCLGLSGLPRGGAPSQLGGQTDCGETPGWSGVLGLQRRCRTGLQTPPTALTPGCGLIRGELPARGLLRRGGEEGVGRGLFPDFQQFHDCHPS